LSKFAGKNGGYSEWLIFFIFPFAIALRAYCRGFPEYKMYMHIFFRNTGDDLFYGNGKRTTALINSFAGNLVFIFTYNLAIHEEAGIKLYIISV